MLFSTLYESPVEQRLRNLGLQLPDLAPRHEFLPVSKLGDVVFVSGHAPFRDGEFHFRGKLGRDFDLEAGRRAAELATLCCLASLKPEIGSLECVRRILKLNGYVNCTPEFTELPKVTDAASALLISLFGDAGRHARTTVGVASLPLNVAVEVEMIVQVWPSELLRGGVHGGDGRRRSYYRGREKGQ